MSRHHFARRQSCYHPKYRLCLLVLAIVLCVSGCERTTQTATVEVSALATLASSSPTPPPPTATATAMPPTVDLAATETAIAATVEARIVANLTATASVAAVQTAAAATVEARVLADLTATAAARPTATPSATASATPEPTATATQVPVTPRPTKTPVPAIVLTLSNMRYERWGRPVRGCAAFNDKDGVRKFNLEMTLQNDTSATIEDWYPTFRSNSGGELLTCFYVYSMEGFPSVPAGEARTVTFASFCELSEYVSDMRVTIDEIEYQRCFSPEGALVGCE